MNTSEQIRNYLAENFLLSTTGFPLDDDASLLESGVVDSTGVLELTLFVEETFRVKVLDEEIVPENFDSVGRITRYVNTKENARSGNGDSAPPETPDHAGP